MLTTPYKVLIACSSLLLLAALGYRVTDLLGGGEAAPPPAASIDGAIPDADASGRDRPDPLADLEPPTRRADAATVSTPGPLPPADPGLAFGTMEPLDAVAEVGTAAEVEAAVPTLVIGRTPGQPRPERRERADEVASADPTAGEVVPGGTLVYVVQPGDTFQGIAQRTLGDANRWSRVAELNPGVDPLRMQVGDRLNLPPRADVPEDAKPPAPGPRRRGPPGRSPGRPTRCSPASRSRSSHSATTATATGGRRSTRPTRR